MTKRERAKTTLANLSNLLRKQRCEQCGRISRSAAVGQLCLRDHGGGQLCWGVFRRYR